MHLYAPCAAAGTVIWVLLTSLIVSQGEHVLALRADRASALPPVLRVSVQSTALNELYLYGGDSAGLWQTAVTFTDPGNATWWMPAYDDSTWLHVSSLSLSGCTTGYGAGGWDPADGCTSTVHKQLFDGV